jgi:hypothetical protein
MGKKKIAELDRLLREYIRVTETGETQGTPAWKAERKLRDSRQSSIFIVGGSEMASFMGLNFRKTLYQFLLEKTIGSDFTGNVATRWGNLFEKVMTHFLEKHFNTKIHDCKSIDGVPHHKYSPDGLGIVCDNYSVQLGSDIRECNMAKIALFEIKCPLTRMPGKSPPAIYMPQIKSGLYTIKPSNFGIFAEGVFRKCSLAEYDNKLEYDTLFHVPSKLEKSKLNKIYDKGLFGFYSPKRDIDEIIDLGNKPEEVFDEFLNRLETEDVYVVIGEGETLHDKKKFITTFCEDINVKLEAFLPWKLLHINICRVEKDETYLDDWIELLQSAAKIVAIAKKSEYPEKVLLKWTTTEKESQLQELYELILAN